ncbi:hypothetical protein ESY86_18520 [Subsaximicrobium wynnwilliamsii]|uniref:Uncharacterized protein n=1 Tax=Subsaximicrobium wynnwilliamsii TaxID=291179 RepID=A0A5C6ZBX5_9FLAO|nr:hypothetical protein [Subsaximicrobium wynnwilliamsii]TXD80951.1 hypothetical protein ESY87_19735 [Subsaximicrobium wynnwilliamsii]TXD86989.1 hypothetical protein ESY86_18520 [Subsaximicrobium wynnwilliamsii]TXE00642.1 hypothetical protein ESY88_18820 [Subsaximicrobium wynnwilliamsii]
MKKNIKAFFKEIVPIIIGILIAIYINNWNEDRKDKNYINRISASINKELTETNNDIIEKFALQETLIDTLDFYKKDDKISILDILMKVNGVSIPSIKISSWKAISNSKIELMEYDKISSLANIEEEKEILKAKSNYVMNLVYSNLNDTGIDKKEILKIMMFDIISTEITIQEEIEVIISE